MRQRGTVVAAGFAALMALAPALAWAGAEVRLDREFLAGVVEKLPPAPFAKAGQYRGSARAFRLVAIDPKTRRLVVACEVGGEYRPPIAGAVRRAVTLPSARPAALPATVIASAATVAPTGAGPKPATPEDTTGWKMFTFDVRASVHAEPGPDGAPRFAVDVEEVKRREMEGLPGALAKVLGRHFDQVVTQVADGKAAAMGEKLNAQIRKKIAAFQDYGVLREIGYTPDQIVLTFDVTKFRSEGVVGYVFAAPAPGTVPLHRWVRPGPGDRYYTVSPDPLPGHPYYRFEAVACHVYPTPQPGTVPLNRFRGPREWVVSTKPDGDGVVRAGYRPDSVACHIYPEARPGTVPLYRFVDPRGVHFYSTHPQAEFLK